MGFGCAYTFSAFVESLRRDFGASRGSVSLVFSLAGFLYFGLGVVSGPLADRWGSRRLALADRIGRGPSLLLMYLGMALALMIWVFSTGIWSLAAFAFVFGVFYGGWVAVLPALVMD
jgi:MFS family permease